MPNSTVPHTPVTYTTTIAYYASNDNWQYDINPKPPLNHAGKPRFKKDDILNWICSYGDWIVFFDGPTPIEDDNGNPLGAVKAGNAKSAGGTLAKKVKDGKYSYRVILTQLNGDGIVVSADPEIIIETDKTRARRIKKKKAGKKPAAAAPVK